MCMNPREEESFHDCFLLDYYLRLNPVVWLNDAYICFSTAHSWPEIVDLVPGSGLLSALWSFSSPQQQATKLIMKAS